MISATILTKNSSKYIWRTLASLEKFPEIIVLDTGSDDNTCQIAQSFPNVRLHRHEFIGFGPTHNIASSLAEHDWIFSIDSDEFASPELIEELFALNLDPQTVYSVGRKNLYRGKEIKACGWYPDFVFRLYNRTITRFSDDFVHERVLTDGLNIQKLKHTIEHIPYGSVDDFINKMQKYTTLFAEQNRGAPSSISKAVLHGFFAFFRSYLLKRGIFYGREGFEISYYNANCAFYKYLKLADISNKAR